MHVFTYTVCLYKTTEGRLRLSQTKTAAEDAGVGVATEALSPELDHFFCCRRAAKSFPRWTCFVFFFFFSYSRPGLHSHIRHPLAPTAGPRRSGERDGRTVQPICFPVGKASCVLFIRRTFSDKSRRMRACRHNYADPVSRFYGLISTSILFAITRQ